MNNTVKLMRDTPRRREQPPLRCRPGDLAMVTRSIDHYGRDRNMLGLMFRVVALVPSPFGNPCWTYEGPLRETTCGGNTWRIDSVADACLSPLRGNADTIKQRRASEPERTSANVAITERATVAERATVEERTGEQGKALVRLR